MADNTKIEWTDASWSPVTGCTKVSPGCDHCYAETITNRFKRHPFEEVQLHPNRLDQPSKWRTPRKIFVCSMGDLFHDAVDFDFVDQVFDAMLFAPQHTYQVLTKRPARMDYFARHFLNGRWPPHVWAGTSVESAKYLPRLDVLARVPAKVRFLSAEPLLGPLDLRPWLQCPDCAHDCFCSPDYGPCEGHRCYTCGKTAFNGQNGILGWVITGGESGPGGRPAHPDWFRGIRDQCQAAGVPYFHKQWGEFAPQEHGNMGRLVGVQSQADTPDYLMRKCGKKAAGALLDGQEWREFPQG